MKNIILKFLAKIFDKFKLKNPMVYSFLLAAVAAVWILNGQGVIHLPQYVVDALLALGLLSGTHTTDILKEGK